jgi:hypothetical protein
MKNRILLFVLSFLAFQSNAQCTWTGAVNNNWSNAGNWSCGHMPTATDDVVINSTNTTVTLDVPTISIASLTMNQSGSIGNGVFLNGNCDIMITGALNMGGFVVIEGTGAVTVGGLFKISVNQSELRLGPRTLTLNGGAEIDHDCLILSIESNELQFTTIIIPLNKTLKCNETFLLVNNVSQSRTGKLINYGTIEISEMKFFECDFEFTNTGTIHVKQGGFAGFNCNSNPPTSTHTGAIFIMEANAFYDQHGSIHNYTNCTMSGAGTFYIGGGGGTCSSNGIANFISGNTVSSEFYMRGGTLNLSQNITLADVEMLGNNVGLSTVNGTGTMTIPTGGHAKLDGAIFNNPFNNQGTIAVLGTEFNNTFINSGIIQSYEYGIGGLNLTNATVTNTGTFSPGNPESGIPIGYISVIPFNNSTSTLAIELAGYSVPSMGIVGNDQLTNYTINPVTLSGTLKISYINGFTPVINDVFTIMYCASGCNGYFSNIVAPSSTTTMWQVDVTTNPNEVRIKLVPIPPTVCTWNGTNVSGNWSDGTKWSCGYAPTTNNNVVINSGTVTLDVSDRTIVDLTLSGGTLTGNRNIALIGALTWSGGTISGTGTMTVAMATTITNAPTLDTRKLTLNGGGTIADGFNTSNGANLIIPLSKTLTVTNSTLILWGGNGGTLTLAGTLIKNGVGALECNFQTFQNTGIVNINEGTLRMGYGGTHSGATFNMATYLGVAKFLTIRGGTHTFDGCIFSGTGGFFVGENATVSSFTNNTVGSMLFNFSIGGTSTFNLGQSLLDLNLFTYFSTNTLTGTFDIAATTVNMSNGTLDFTGELTIRNFIWSGGTIGSHVITRLPLGSVSTTSNTVTANGIVVHNGALTVQSGIFNCNRFANNFGTITIQSGTVNATGEFENFSGNLTLQTGDFNANADFYNSGTLTIQAGTFTANAAFINSADLIIESGILNVNGAFTNNAGTVEIRTGTLNAASTFEMNNGILKGKGTLNLNSTFINTDDNTIAPGLSPGTFRINLTVPSTVTPSVTNTETGIIEIEIVNTGNASMPIIAHDLLQAAGNIQLAGTLNLLLSGPIASGTTMNIIQSLSGTITGVFTIVNFNGGGLPSSVLVNYGSNAVSLIFTAPLSVELLNFKAKAIDKTVELTWQTANETNNKGFQIERSVDGKTFETIGFVQAKGINSTYSFIDKGPLSINYYRLRQMDNDGKETVSKVVTVHLQQKGFYAKAYPNPFGNDLTVEVSTEKKTDVEIELIDILGRQVYGKNSPNTEGSLSVPILIKDLPNGTYFLKVSDGQQMIQQKVIKN